MKASRVKQFGIGLLELMLSLSIIAILLIMATRYYLVTSYSQKLRQATNLMTAVQGAVYSWKGARTTYTGVTVQVLIDQGLLSGADVSGGALISPWGTAISFTPTANSVALAFEPGSTADEKKKGCQALDSMFKSMNDPSVTATCSGSLFTYTFY